MKVFGWKADTSACGFYRMERPLAALADISPDWTVTCSLSTSELEMWEQELLIVQRMLVPESFAYVIKAHRQGGLPLIYEIDDLLTAIDPSNPARGQLDTAEFQLVFEIAIRDSDLITTSTEPLADELSAFNRNIKVLPNCLPDYFTELSAKAASMERGDEPRVLWAGSDSHHGDFGAEPRYGLTRLMKWTDATFTAMGYDYRKHLGVKGDFVPWAKDIPSFHSRLPGFDIGICPLAPTRFNRSKSGLKAIEYQAAGIVPVVSDCDAYRPVVEHGVTGFLCRTGDDWKEAMMSLATDSDLLAEMRANCLSLTAERLYSANAWRWREAYEPFVGQRGQRLRELADAVN